MGLLLRLSWIIQATAVVGWADIVKQKLHLWSVNAVKMLPNVLAALVVWMAFYLAARMFRRFGHPLTRRLSRSQAIAGLYFDLLYVAIIVLGLYVGLNVLRLDKIAVSLLAGAGILGLTLAFAFQDLTSNFISGVCIDFNKPFGIGDVIETNGITGTVEDIGLRTTTLRTLEGTLQIMPNKTIFQNTLINHSRTRVRAVSVAFEMAISDSMDGIARALVSEVAQVQGLDVTKTPECVFTDIAANNVKVCVFFWVVHPSEQQLMRIRHQVILAVLKAFRDQGVKRL